MLGVGGVEATDLLCDDVGVKSVMNYSHEGYNL